MRQSLSRVFELARPAFFLISCAVVFAAGGCGSNAPYRCVPVSGTVAYQDGSLIPAEQIHLTFLSQAQPVNATSSLKNGVADADGKTGKFDYATTFAPHDGLIAGQHKVTVQCISKGRVRTDLVPAEYGDADKTPLRAQTDKLPLELKIRKPAMTK